MAPEIYTGDYDEKIDMWSLGCIVAELLTGDPLFQGDSEADQLYAIMEVLGYPPEGMLGEASKFSKFFNEDGTVKNTMNSRGKIRVTNSKTIEDKVQTEDFVLIDFLKIELLILSVW